MADTPLAPLTKARPMTKEKAFVIAALRRHVAALDGIDEAALPTEFQFVHGGVEVLVTNDSYIVAPAGSVQS